MSIKKIIKAAYVKIIESINQLSKSDAIAIVFFIFLTFLVTIFLF